MKKLFSLLLALMILISAPASVNAGAYSLPGIRTVFVSGDIIKPEDNETDILIKETETNAKKETGTEPEKETETEPGKVKETDTDKKETDTDKTETDTDKKETDKDKTETDTDKKETDTDKKETDTQPDKPKKGDADSDGVITSADSLMTLRFSIGLQELSKTIQTLVDMDEDGTVTSGDALRILHLSLGIDLSEVSRQYKETLKEHGEELQQKKDQEKDPNDYSVFKRGIDISHWNGWVDFDAMKKQGIEFVILNAGYGKYASQKDPMFESNYKRAKAAGLDVGAYWYPYAQSEYDSRCEAWTCISCIKDKQFEYPIYFDIEENFQFKKGKAFCTSIVNAFCSEMEAAGYYAGFYTSVSFCKEYIDTSTQLRYCYWAADWSDRVHYSNPYGIWQYDVAEMEGCKIDVDMNFAFVDYPRIMKECHRNGY